MATTLGPQTPPLQLMLEFEQATTHNPASTLLQSSNLQAPEADQSGELSTAVEVFEDEELEFLEAVVRYNAEALWTNSSATIEAAKWFYNGGTSAPASFLKICRVLDADPRVIIREVMVEFHRRQLNRIVAREPRWQEIASWYAEKTNGYFPIDWLVRASTISKSVLQQDAYLATASSEDEIDSEEFGYVQCMAA